MSVPQPIGDGSILDEKHVQNISRSVRAHVPKGETTDEQLK